MSKFLDISEFLHKAKQDSMPSDDKNLGQASFENSDFKYKIDFFNTGHDMAYCEYRCVSNKDLLVHLQEESGFYFLCFNTGQRANYCGYGKRRILLEPNTAWIGTIRQNFEGFNEYHQDQLYQNQAIMIGQRLVDELEIFKNLALNDEKIAFCESQISTSQRLILNELKQAKILSGKLKEIFMESRILEILYKSLAKNEPNFDMGESKYLLKAKNILLDNLQNPPSIKELAHLCATNEFRLKKEFKAYFGTTIYAMLQDERLKIAKELLEKDDISVNEAAKMVGYHSLSHFAKIFREKFEILPTQLRRKKSYLVGGEFDFKSRD